jgi:hypothetical protein
MSLVTSLVTFLVYKYHLSDHAHGWCWVGDMISYITASSLVLYIIN